MAETTRNLGLPLIAAAQAQKHVTHNEALGLVDALVQLSVKDRDRNAPPGSALEGDRYIVGPVPIGAWIGLADQIVLRLDGVWNPHPPRPGWVAYVEDEALLVAWDGTAWRTVADTPAQLLAKLLTVDGDGSGLDADLIAGLRNETHAALSTMRTMMVGGGTLSLSGAGEVKWTSRILAVGMGRGPHWSTAGSFDIAVPAVGATVPGLGAPDRSVAAGGIPLGLGEALYYAPPTGTGGASAPGNFRIVGTAVDIEVPAASVCLCLRNPDNGDVVFWNGLKLSPGQSYDRATSTAARPKVSGLGIGTDSDALNALAVASPAILFTHAGAGVQAKLNKASAVGTASILFQDNYSSRAEFGLIGSDVFSLKVSPDGASFIQAYSVDPATGRVSFDAGALRTETVVLTASGTWTKPAWARAVTIVCLGGGGGGGSGRRGAAASVRAGGGGGGPGALSSQDFFADDLPATLTVTVGAGGAGGAAVTIDAANGSAGGAGADSTVSAAGTVILAALGGSGGGGGTAAAGGGGLAGQGQNMFAASNGISGSTGGGGGNQTNTSMITSGGGGGGGGISATDVATSGTPSNWGYLIGGMSGGRGASPAAGGAIGSGGANGQDKRWVRGAASGGAGGGAGAGNGSSTGGGGGAGGAPGGGGGGGGGSTNGAASGAGGNGGRGEVWMICRG